MRRHGLQPHRHRREGHAGTAGQARSELEVERVIVAAGIVGNVENLGLEGTRVKVEKSHIVTDGLCRTGEPGVYAIGDVAGAPGWRTRPAMKVCCA